MTHTYMLVIKQYKVLLGKGQGCPAAVRLTQATAKFVANVTYRLIA